MDRDLLRPADVQALARIDDAPRASVYLPTHRGGPETRQDPVRLRNLLRTARETAAVMLDHREAEDLVAPAEQLLDDEDFWQHQADGLAVFLDGALRTWRLPLSFDELVVVAPRFHIMPVLRHLSLDRRFAVLALAQNDVRLFLGSRDALEELEPEGMPRSVQEATQWDDPDRHVEWHTRTARTPSGDRAAIFHGHGAAKDAHEDRLLRFGQQVDHAVARTLGPEDVPLILAGTQEVTGVYRNVNSYGRLLEEAIQGNPERLSAADLLARAWPIMQGIAQREQAELMDRIRSHHANGRGEDGIVPTVRAASRGLVDTLVVADHVHAWGSFEPDRDEVNLHDERRPHDEDLLNAAAIMTLRYGGRVLVVERDEMPTPQPIAAVERAEVTGPSAG